MLIELSEGKQIQQLVSIAGDGKLKDDSDCAKEIRDFLSLVDIEALQRYIKQCWEKSFSDSGRVLQDLVNELGRRLDFNVRDGLYQGRSNQIGFDGLWDSPEKFSIVVEVKTTDAYRISLDTLAKHRSQLISSGEISEDSSILIVVGRQDTGDLEAQVRGSKNAWDIRIISADALVALAKVKVAAEEDTSEKMRILLRPIEYTRLDSLVDIIYATAQDSEELIESKITASESTTKKEKKESTREFTDSKLLYARRAIDARRANVITSFSALKGKKLVKKTRTSFWSADRSLRVCCTISKRYEKRGRYWYAYHPQWDEFLESADEGFLILGGMGLNSYFAIPREEIVKILPYLSITNKEYGKSSWHLVIAEPEEGSYELVLPKKNENLELRPFIIRRNS